ncbi:MAG: hypothetical protein FWD44_00980 [Oscillospiraceae bacterium]|nr:hypothetical protein [Oscillospiraceae bacterium]
MVGNVNSNKAPQPYTFESQAQNKHRSERKITDFSNVDRIDISIDALRASQKIKNQELLEEEQDEITEAVEELLEEYKNTGVVDQTKSEDDTIAREARMKMTAMKIAMRISKGDIVPMQDHRFLAEYDSKLYKAAMNASVVANNKDPKRHESLADELAADESAGVYRKSQVAEENVDSDAAGEVVNESSEPV